jgi:hypothetical protein
MMRGKAQSVGAGLLLTVLLFMSGSGQAAAQSEVCLARDEGGTPRFLQAPDAPGASVVSVEDRCGNNSAMIVITVLPDTRSADGDDLHQRDIEILAFDLG